MFAFKLFTTPIFESKLCEDVLYVKPTKRVISVLLLGLLTFKSDFLN